MSAVVDQVQTEMPAPILFTDSAAAKVADLIADGDIARPPERMIRPCPWSW